MARAAIGRRTRSRPTRALPFGAIEPSVTQAEINRARTKPTSNLDAYDYFLRAFQQSALFTREGSDAAMDNIRQAIALDPGYALAKAYLSVNYMLRWTQGWGAPGDPEKGLAVAREAIVQGSDDPSVLRWAGHTLGFWGDYDRAIALLEKAARLNVNGSQILSSLGWVKVYACTDPDRAIAHFERSIRLSPRDPDGLDLNGSFANEQVWIGTVGHAPDHGLLSISVDLLPEPTGPGWTSPPTGIPDSALLNPIVPARPDLRKHASRTASRASCAASPAVRPRRSAAARADWYIPWPRRRPGSSIPRWRNLPPAPSRHARGARIARSPNG